MTGTAASVNTRASGFAALPAGVDLTSTASGAWIDLGLSLALPAAGTYHLDAVVRGNLGRMGTGENALITARLWDVTAGAIVPNSEAIVVQISEFAPGAATALQWNSSTAISVEYKPTSPRTIRLEAARTDIAGTTEVAGIGSDTLQRTTLRYARLT
ncbi:hypothetical protein F5972_08135 [Microbispora cellulosiformans]|uniref:Uncharacterized protein n=1 Tax=Microbispora cellulosiformans TaxID=2614688 RepID=A0A5J5K4U8_9ACTN|nr:hypothetical protein [Microbispora cellulosiformans]KAA9379615.1 hypothetical protein F5972_08135 [Microbispora cellulosiformans]